VCNTSSTKNVGILGGCGDFAGRFYIGYDEDGDTELCPIMMPVLQDMRVYHCSRAVRNMGVRDHVPQVNICPARKQADEQR
jgi:hypothetical protein